MITKDRFQEEKEEEVSRELLGLFNMFFQDMKMDNTIIYSDYYSEPTRAYQICMKAKELGLLFQICNELNIDYEFQDYEYNKETSKFDKSFFKFNIRDKKELKKSMVITYPKYLHK